MKKSSKRQPDSSFSDTDSRHDYDRDEIARRAHSLWERNGRPEGRDEEFWFSAERELRGDSAEDNETERNEGERSGTVRQMEMSARPADGPAVDDQNESRTADAASTRGSRAHR